MKHAPFKSASKNPAGTPKSVMRLYSRGYKRLYLNASERNIFFENAKAQIPAIRFVCLVLFYTGCRISEALNITVGDIQWDDGIIAIRSLKKRDLHHVREIPVPQWLIDQMQDVFDVSVHTDPSTRILTQSRTTAWRQVCRVMIISEIFGDHATPRGLRHSFGVHCAMNNIPMPLCQKWMGHSSLKVTAIYYQIVGPEERSMATRLWNEDMISILNVAHRDP